MEEKRKFKTIGVLTSGGDAPGMNAATRAVVRAAIAQGLTVKGIMRGYKGLLDEEIVDLTADSVSGIIMNGGTLLLTARCKEFMEEEGQKKGAEICRKYGIDGVVVLGGDGSFRGAQKLTANGINTIGIPCTIDMDIDCTDYTIGYDTACNTVLEAIDKIRDTSSSHERCTIIEVMGRDSGYIGIMTGLAGGAADILLPETYDGDVEKIVEHVREKKERGKLPALIINSEGIGKSAELAKVIEDATGVETRAAILGHIQRGGRPTVRDRYIASMMGVKAVDLLLEGKSNRVVAYSKGEFVDFDIDEALAMQKSIDPELLRAYELIRK